MKILIAIFSYLLSYQAFADSKLIIHGLNDDVVQRSPAGILIAIKFNDGAIVNPSFSPDELRNGTIEKTIIEENRSIVSCTYNWLFVARSDDFAPRNFQGISDGVCKASEAALIIETPAVVRHAVITVEKSAFDSLAASRLILTITAEDSISSIYPQKIQQVRIDNTPMMIERTFVQISNSELNFVLKPLWIRSVGNIQGDPISFREDEFILE